MIYPLLVTAACLIVALWGTAMVLALRRPRRLWFTGNAASALTRLAESREVLLRTLKDYENEAQQGTLAADELARVSERLLGEIAVVDQQMSALGKDREQRRVAIEAELAELRASRSKDSRTEAAGGGA